MFPAHFAPNRTATFSLASQNVINEKNFLFTAFAPSHDLAVTSPIVAQTNHRKLIENSTNQLIGTHGSKNKLCNHPLSIKWGK
jgi:hypothetical protein